MSHACGFACNPGKTLTGIAPEKQRMQLLAGSKDIVPPMVVVEQPLHLHRDRPAIHLVLQHLRKHLPAQDEAWKRDVIDLDQSTSNLPGRAAQAGDDDGGNPGKSRLQRGGPGVHH